MRFQIHINRARVTQLCVRAGQSAQKPPEAEELTRIWRGFPVDAPKRRGWKVGRPYEPPATGDRRGGANYGNSRGVEGPGGNRICHRRTAQGRPTLLLTERETRLFSKFFVCRFRCAVNRFSILTRRVVADLPHHGGPAKSNQASRPGNAPVVRREAPRWRLRLTGFPRFSGRAWLAQTWENEKHGR